MYIKAENARSDKRQTEQSPIVPRAPYSLETEEALIGTAIAGYPAAIDGLLSLAPEDFYGHITRPIAEAIQGLHTEGQSVNLQTVYDWLVRHQKTNNGEITFHTLAVLDSDAQAQLLPGHGEQLPDIFASWVTIIRQYAYNRAKASVLTLQAQAALQGQDPDEAALASYQQAVQRLEAGETTEFMGVDELLQEPGVQYLIKGIVPMQSLAMCHAAESNLKSFVVDDMLFHIAAGRAWHGHTVTQGKVAFVLNEGGAGFNKRLRGWEKIHQVSLRGQVIVRKPRKGVPLFQLNEPSDVTRLIAALKAEGASIVCFDTLSSMIPGVNPNGGDGGMNATVAHVRRIRDEAGVTCLYVHHNNKNGEAKGATDFIAAMDVRFSTEAKKDGKGVPTSVAVHCEKPRDDTPFPNLAFSVKVVDVPTEENLYETTLVLLPDGEAAPTPPRLTTKQRETLCALEDGMSAGEWLKATRVAESTFFEHVKLLRSNGYVHYEEGTERYCVSRAGRELLRFLQSEQKQSSRSEATGPELYSGYSGLSLETGVTGVSPASLARQQQDERGHASPGVFPNHLLNTALVEGTAAKQPDTLKAPITQDMPSAPTEPISLEAAREKRTSGPRGPAESTRTIQDESTLAPEIATPARNERESPPTLPEQRASVIKQGYQDWSEAESRTWLLDVAESKHWDLNVTYEGLRYGTGDDREARKQDWQQKVAALHEEKARRLAHALYQRRRNESERKK